MIRRVIEQTGLNLRYKCTNKKRFFSFNVMEYVLTDEENNDYLLAIAFIQEDKFVLKKAYDVISEKYNCLNSLCFDFEELFVLFCPIWCCKELSFDVTSNSIYPVIEICNDIDFSEISFSLNKFNLMFPKNSSFVINITTKSFEEHISLTIDGTKAKIGTWNTYVPRTHFFLVLEQIFNRFPQINEIEYENVLFDPIIDKRRWRHNDFYLPLPETIEELKMKISAKSRHNIKREKRIIEETFGSFRLEDIDVTGGFPSEVIESFYKFKESTHEVTIEEYDITKRNITNAYILKTGKNDIRGVALSCEQGDIVFIENHTFDSSLKQYSFGQVLYDLYLEELIKKGKKGLSLAGGDLAYKKRYGSICFIAYSGIIKRNKVALIKRLKQTNWNYSDLLTKLMFIFSR